MGRKEVAARKRRLLRMKMDVNLRLQEVGVHPVEHPWLVRLPGEVSDFWRRNSSLPSDS